MSSIRHRRQLVWRVALALALTTAPLVAVELQAAEILTQAEDPLVLGVGKGQLVRFDRPVDSVFLADPAIADVKVVSPRVVYLFGNAVGRTNFFAVADGERVVASLALRVAPDTAAARQELRSLRPDSTVDLSFIGGRLVANGTVGSVDEAVDVNAVAESLAPPGTQPSNRTTLNGSQQINLRVRFAEVSRTDMFELGINWQAVLNSGDFTFGLATGDFFVPGLNTLREGGVNGFGSYAGSDFSIDGIVDALQQEGVLTVLAEPNLTALSGETATFLAGGEFPVPVPQDGDTITIEYKTFGVSLAFTPTLLPGNRIGMRVRPEVSQLAPNGGVELQGFNIPALTTRRAETSVELASGQTFAMAGLLQQVTSNDIDKVPLLGDLPVIGNLFNSVRYRNEETELVILITPFLVEPSRERRLSIPDRPVADTTAPSTARRAGLAGFIIN